MDEADMVRFGKKSLDSEYADFYLANPIMLHSFAGAWILETEFGINDRSVLDAVKWHCSAHPLMDENAKILYIADYIESTRKHISAEHSGRVLKMELDEALFSILREEEKYYNKPGAAICPDWKNLYTQLEQNRRHEK
jgi:predicted HD superfamily hydrolase involved in NAD metabolism